MQVNHVLWDKSFRLFKGRHHRLESESYMTDYDVLNSRQQTKIQSEPPRLGGFLCVLGCGVTSVPPEFPSLSTCVTRALLCPSWGLQIINQWSLLPGSVHSLARVTCYAVGSNLQIWAEAELWGEDSWGFLECSLFKIDQFQLYLSHSRHSILL